MLFDQTEPNSWTLSSFHGRSIGCLSVTHSKAIHLLDIPLMGWPTCRYPRYKYPLVSIWNPSSILESVAVFQNTQDTNISPVSIKVFALLYSKIQAENERENLEEDNACLAEVFLNFFMLLTITSMLPPCCQLEETIVAQLAKGCPAAGIIAEPMQVPRQIVCPVCQICLFQWINQYYSPYSPAGIIAEPIHPQHCYQIVTSGGRWGFPWVGALVPGNARPLSEVWNECEQLFHLFLSNKHYSW